MKLAAAFVLLPATANAGTQPPEDTTFSAADLVCEYDGDAVATPTRSETRYYELTQNSVGVNMALMDDWSRKMFKGGSGKEWGWFDYTWSAEVKMAEQDPIVAQKVCIKSAYKVIGPKFTDRKVRKCFEQLTAYIFTHEETHVATTQGVIDRTAADMVGQPRDGVKALLDSLDAEIAAANHAFHQTPEAKASPRIIPSRRCAG